MKALKNIKKLKKEEVVKKPAYVEKAHLEKFKKGGKTV
jgi:hypothetical protein